MITIIICIIFGMLYNFYTLILAITSNNKAKAVFMMNNKFTCALLLPTILAVVTLLYPASLQAQETDSTTPALNSLEEKLNKVSQYYQDIENKLNKRPLRSNNKYIQANTKRDPFSYTDQMYRNQQNTPQTGNNLTSNALLLAATTAFTADGLPIMKYRGYAESPSGEVIGILEILGMGVYTVRVGDQIGLHDIVKELVLIVEGLNRNNIIIKTGKLGKKLVVQ